MELATVREAVNLVNNTKAITPYTLRQVLESYATVELVKQLIAEAEIDPSQIDLSSYAKKTDIPTKLSQLDNDDNYVQTIDGIIPAQYLPSYVDDVLEYSSSSLFPNPGDAGKIYVDTTTNLTYRWGGSGYVEISKSLALGTTSNTAYRGDHGLIAYQHTSLTGNPHGLTLGDLSITVDAETINYLEGLSENILTALYKKLNTAGGTLSGYLTLHHDPVEKMHAATKFYVDTMIDGISVTVTQNVTRITELTDNLEEQQRVIGVQADTITKVENDITGLNQTTENHTEAISSLEQNVSGLSSTVSKTSESVTTLEATINLISLDLAQDVIVIPVDKDNKPVTTAQYKVKYTVKFRGNVIDPEEMTIEGESEGINITKDDEFIIVNVDSTEAIAKTTTGYTIKVKYTQTVPYEDGKVLAVVLVPKGEDGAQGEDGAPGTPGEDGKTLYTWIKYADTPTSGMSNDPTGKTYMGIAYNKESSVESEDYNDYTWSLTKGEQGIQGEPGKDGEQGPQGEQGPAGADGQPGKDGQDGAPGKDGEQGIQGPEGPQGEQGPQGIPGVGIVSIVEYYYLSTNSSTQTGGSWSPNYPGWANGKYIWTKTIFTYSDGSTKETDPICVTGAQGQTGMTGAAGTSITNVDVLYYQSTSNTSQTGGSWQSTVPVWSEGKYIWTKTKVTYTDADAVTWSEETAPVCVTGSKGATGEKGEDGAKGETGTSFSHIINWYAFGDDSTTAPSSGWSTLLTTRPEGKILWIKEEIFLSDGTSSWGTPYPVTGDTGAKGDTGSQGPAGEDAAVSSLTAPTDTTKLWLDLNDGKLKRYETTQNEDGTTTGTWIIINDLSSDIQANSDNIGSLTEELNTKLEELGLLIQTVETTTNTRIDQTDSSVTFQFQEKTKEITELMDKITEHVTTQDKYIKLEDGTITLGFVGNAYSLYIDNDDIIMLRGDIEISRWHQDIFQSKILSMHDPVLTPGYAFQWVPRNNGSYSLRKVAL